MWAPSIPLPAEPSTRLSRVVAQEACLATSTPVIPYLANSPFSAATISGEASVRAMKPSVALVVSGPAAWAMRAPNGNAAPAAAKVAAAAVDLRKVRRDGRLGAEDMRDGSLVLARRDVRPRCRQGRQRRRMQP